MHNRHTAWLAAVVTATVGFVAVPAAGQQAINTTAATQPGKDQFVLRQQFRYWTADEDPNLDADRKQNYTSLTTLDYGLESDLALTLEFRNAHRRYTDRDTGRRESDFDVDDVTGLVKFRAWQDDFGPIDTARFSVFGGAEYRPGNAPRDDGSSINPIIGAVYTHIEGRHGYNVAGQWKFHTGRGVGANDEGRYDLAYLYRLSPAEYADDTYASLYAVAELNGRYETSGENELSVAPGLLYEARTWAAEATVQIPVWQDLKHQPEPDYRVGVGLRLLF